MAEIRKYELVSEALYVAVREHPQDTPVYRQWLTYMGNFEKQVPACWDEEAVITHVRGMLLAANQLFAFLPEPVRKLKEVHEVAEKGGIEYLRYAFSVKLNEISGILATARPKAQYEKFQRNIQRGIERRIAGIEHFAILDLLTKIGPLMEEMEDLTFQEEGLMTIISILKILEEMRARLAERLGKLGGPLRTVEHKTSLVSTLDLFDEHRPAAKRGKKGKDQNPDAKPPKQEASPSVQEFDAAKVSLTKMRKAIELAEACGKLRVIVPHREVVRQNSEAKWKTLFGKLGYAGEVEFLTFEELSRSCNGNGTEIPLVMLRSLNTHANLWDKKRYSNIFVLDVKTQNAISSIL